MRHLEGVLGAALPQEYRTFLAEHKEIDGPQWVVSTNPDYWGVRSLFEIGSGPEHVQTDEVYRLAGDAVPKGMMPVADDISGNLFLLDCRAQPTHGAVYWWDHEQDVGEDRVEKVADSFRQFLAVLVPESD